MSNVKFPARREDGTFQVEIVMSVTADGAGSLCADIQEWWNNEWFPKNQIWRRIWTSAGSESIEDLTYCDEFSSPPRVLPGDSPQLHLVLEGKSSAKWWKDWMVMRVIPDLKSRFPQIGEVQAIRDFEQV
jgi:hypothetical protein